MAYGGTKAGTSGKYSQSGMQGKSVITSSSMGATAFQKGLGAIHSLSHPVGAIYNTHHGLTNAIFMPYVLTYNKNEIDHKIKKVNN